MVGYLLLSASWHSTCKCHSHSHRRSCRSSRWYQSFSQGTQRIRRSHDTDSVCSLMGLGMASLDITKVSSWLRTVNKGRIYQGICQSVRLMLRVLLHSTECLLMHIINRNSFSSSTSLHLLHRILFLEAHMLLWEPFCLYASFELMVVTLFSLLQVCCTSVIIGTSKPSLRKGESSSIGRSSR